MMQRKRKHNIFQQKRGLGAAAAGGGGDHSALGVTGGGTENWVLSEMGSDTLSVGGDSNSSYQSNLLSKPKFMAASFL